MFNFSEHFMEECLIECPKAFLGDSYTILHQQPRIGGFIPDVIMQNNSGITIVEIQKDALNRFHLYKTLEYRDLFVEHRKVAAPRVLLLCNEIEEKYKKICATHSVDIVSISRDDWIDIALKNCPGSIAAEFKTQALRNDSVKSIEAKPEIDRSRFVPLHFDEYTDAHTYWHHLSNELERFGFANSDHRYRGLVSDLDNFFRDGLEDALKAVSPVNWDIDKLLIESEGWVPEELKNRKRIRKPKIVLATHLTQKGNLSLYWRPAGEHYANWQMPKYDFGDWISWCGDSTYGWSRPPNELLFLHDFNHLGPREPPGAYDTMNWFVVEELILTITKKIHEMVSDYLSSIVSVTKITDFELKTQEDEPRSRRFDSNSRVVGWEIFNVEERSLKDEKAQLEEFLLRHSLDAAGFISAFQNAGKKRNRQGSNVEYLRRDFKERGILLGKREIEAALARTEKFYPGLWTKPAS